LVVVLAVVPAQASEFRRGNGAEPDTLDPGKRRTVPADRIAHDLFEGLTAPRPGGGIGPGSALDWAVSADGLTWTFHLRPELRWSDGAPLDARDFVYSFRREVDPATAAEFAFLLHPIHNARAINEGKIADLAALGVEAPDPLTLRITLDAPNAALPAMLTQILPSNAKSVAESGAEAFRPGHLISNGAYRLVEWAPQSRIVLERNPNYWDAAHVAIDRVVYLPIENENEELKRYRAGEVDFTYQVPHEQAALVARDLGTEYHVSPYFGVFYIGLNVTRPPFLDSPKLRQALALAIDRQILVDKIVGGGTHPAYGWVPPGLADYPAARFPWAEAPRAEREAMAKAAFAAAGYGPDHKLSLEILYNTSENNRRVVVAVAGMWHQVLGVDATLTNMEFKAFLETVKSRKMPGAYRLGYISLYDDPGPMLELERSDSAQNYNGYASPAFDRFYDQGDRAPDRTARFQGFAAAEAQLLADIPVIPLYFYTSEHLIKPRITGWQPSPRDTFRSQDLAITE
jgi:oligopeptide transport system substrate-binding protein